MPEIDVALNRLCEAFKIILLIVGYISFNMGCIIIGEQYNLPELRKFGYFMLGDPRYIHI